MKTIAEWILTSGVSNSSDMAVVGVFVTFYWSGAMIGRFIGSYLTKIVKPAKVLSFFATCAIGLIIISNISTGLVAMWSIIAVGLFNSIMFPTIFSLGLDGLGDDKPQGSGVLCTMIVGGAIIPPAYGFLTDTFNFNIALILVIVCYAYILLYGYLYKKSELIM
jgi:FHS family L-fucose permease-like MFS transporter